MSVIIQKKGNAAIKVISSLILQIFIATTIMPAYAFVNTKAIEGSYLAPEFTIQTNDFQSGVDAKIKDENALTNKVDTLDELESNHSDLYREIQELKKEFEEYVRTVDEAEIQDQPNQTNKHEIILAMKKELNSLEYQIKKISKTEPEETIFTAEELSKSVSKQNENNDKLLGEIKNSTDLNQVQKNIITRWATYSLKTELPLATIDMSDEERAEYFARIRAGLREIMVGIVAYSKMLKLGEVNPDAVQLRTSPNDNTAEVKIGMVNTPDGQRRANIVSFPGKDDSKHLGHIITALNVLVDGKTDKLIMEVDNFDYRKKSMTSLVLREVQGKWGAKILNELFGKEVVVYSPWMKEDRTLAPDGEHILPLIIEHNFKANPWGVINNAVWKHLAGSDHQRVVYPENKDAGLDTIGKVKWIRKEVVKILKKLLNELEVNNPQKLRLPSDVEKLGMGAHFNGRPGEVASELLTAVQAYISGLKITTSVQGFHVSSSEVRERNIWALGPEEISRYMDWISSTRWQFEDSMGVDYEKEGGLKRYKKGQEAIAAKVINYTKGIMAQTSVNDTQIEQEMAKLLNGSKGIALQTADRFLSSIRDALLRLPEGTKQIDLKQDYDYDYSLYISDRDLSIKRVETIREQLFDYVGKQWEIAQNDFTIEGIAPKDRAAILSNPKAIEGMIKQGFLEFRSPFMAFLVNIIAMTDPKIVEQKGFIDIRTTAQVGFAI